MVATGRLSFTLYVQCVPCEDVAVFCLIHPQRAKVCHPALYVLTHMYVYACVCAHEEVVM